MQFFIYIFLSITYSSNFVLLSALLNALVHGRTLVTVESRRTALAAHVDIDGEEDLAAALRLPLRSEGLAAVVVGRVGRVDAARIVLELRPVEDLVGVQAAALVGLVQLDDVGAEQVGLTNVAARLAAILVVDGLNLGKVVSDSGCLLNGAREGGEGYVGRSHAVIGGPRVVLDLLDEDEIGVAELVDNLVNNARKMGRVRCQVLRIVGSDGHTSAVAGAVEGDGRVFERSLGDRGHSSQRENAVEAKIVVNDTGNVAEIVAEFGIGWVLGTVKRSTHGDGLWVGIYI